MSRTMLMPDAALSLLAQLPIASSANVQRFLELPSDLAAYDLRIGGGTGLPDPTQSGLRYDADDVANRKLRQEAMLARVQELVRNNRFAGNRFPSILDATKDVLAGSRGEGIPNLEILRETGGQGSGATSALTRQISRELQRPFEGPGLILDPRMRRRRHTGAFADSFASLAAMEILNSLGGKSGERYSVPGLGMTLPEGMDPREVVRLLTESLRDAPEGRRGEIGENQRWFKDAINEERGRVGERLPEDLNPRVKEVYSHRGLTTIGTPNAPDLLRPYFGRHDPQNLGVTVPQMDRQLVGYDIPNARVLDALSRTVRRDLSGGPLGGARISPTDLREVILWYAGQDRQLGRAMTVQEWNRLPDRVRTGITAELPRFLSNISYQMEASGGLDRGTSPDDRRRLGFRSDGRLAAQDLDVYGPRRREEQMVYSDADSRTDRRGRPIDALARRIRDRVGVVDVPEARVSSPGSPELSLVPEEQRTLESEVADRNLQEQRAAGEAGRKSLEITNPTEVRTPLDDFYEGYEDKLRGGTSTVAGRPAQIKRNALGLAVEGALSIVDTAEMLPGLDGKKADEKVSNRIAEARRRIQAFQSRIASTPKDRRRLAYSALTEIQYLLDDLPDNYGRELRGAYEALASSTNVTGDGSSTLIGAGEQDPDTAATQRQINKAADRKAGDRLQFVPKEIDLPKEKRYPKRLEYPQPLPGDTSLRASANSTLSRLGLESAAAGQSPTDFSGRADTRRRLAGLAEDRKLYTSKGLKRDRLMLLTELMGKQQLSLPEGRNNPLFSDRAAVHALGFTPEQYDVLAHGYAGIDPDRMSGLSTRRALARGIKATLGKANTYLDIMDEIVEKARSGDKQAAEDLKGLVDDMKSGRAKGAQVKSRFEAMAERYAPTIALPGTSEYDRGRPLGYRTDDRGRSREVTTMARPEQPSLMKVSNRSARATFTGSDGEPRTLRDQAYRRAQQDPAVEREIEQDPTSDRARKLEKDVRKRAEDKLRRHRRTSPGSRKVVNPKGTGADSPSGKARQAISVADANHIEAKIEPIVRRLGEKQSVTLTEAETRFFSRPKNERYLRVLMNKRTFRGGPPIIYFSDGTPVSTPDRSVSADDPAVQAGATQNTGSQRRSRGRISLEGGVNNPNDIANGLSRLSSRMDLLGLARELNGAMEGRRDADRSPLMRDKDKSSASERFRRVEKKVEALVVELRKMGVQIDDSKPLFRVLEAIGKSQSGPRSSRGSLVGRMGRALRAVKG